MNEILTTQPFEVPKTVYVPGFGVCYVGESLYHIPDRVRYYGSDSDYDVYGTDDPLANRYLPGDTVEFYAIKHK